MNILQIDVILLNIVKDIDFKSIANLFITDKHLNAKISKYYRNNEIILNEMPLFRSCDNISTYLKNYNSYISGENFPEEPLWLFKDINDERCIKVDNKYVKLQNNRFNKSKFFNYFTSYNFIPFKGGLYHWKKLNNDQKYLLWCAITSYHPEIKLNKSLISENLAVLLSELYWHYKKSFVRYYLEIYCIDNCDLINAKCIAKNEITSELAHYRGTHFFEGYNNAPDKKLYTEYYLTLYQFDTKKDLKEHDFRLQLLYIINGGLNHLHFIRSFEDYNFDSDILLKEIDTLLDILNDIDEFTITKTNKLSIYDINYLTHMSKNYNESAVGSLTVENSCKQQ